MLKILIADDHSVVRAGIKQILSQTSDMEVAGEAANAQELLEKVRSQNWSAVTLDITMPGRSGLEILKELRKEKPSLPVLILSIHPQNQYAIRAIKAGAAGYMSKECAPEELVTALRKICKGEKYIPSSLAELLAFEIQKGSERPLFEKLSDREYEVMMMISEGQTSKTIAKHLSLSIKTISTYRARILEKLRLKNNSELMHYVIRENLIRKM